MKDILLVAASYGESAMLRQEIYGSREELPFFTTPYLGQTVSLIHTGIGMVNTAFQLGSYLSHHKPDVMLQFGIAGSFKRTHELGKVVEIREEIFGDMGAQSPSGFLDLKQMGFPLMKKNGIDHFNSLSSPYYWNSGLEEVRGLTVNEVSGVPSQIAFRMLKWEADMESMEGAAFFHAALNFDIPFVSIRANSNLVESRNKANWDIGLAVKNVQQEVLKILEEGKIHQIAKVPENP